MPYAPDDAVGINNSLGMQVRLLEASELTGPVLRAARVLAGFSAGDLARMASLGLATIKRAEAAPGHTPLTQSNANAVLKAYETVGICFFGDDGGGVGVLRRVRTATKQ